MIGMLVLVMVMVVDCRQSMGHYHNYSLHAIIKKRMFFFLTAIGLHLFCCTVGTDDEPNQLCSLGEVKF